MQKLALHVLPLALVFVATAAAAQRSELSLQVADMDGNELGPVSLTFTSPEGEVVEAATKKNGKLKIPAEGGGRAMEGAAADGGLSGPGERVQHQRGPRRYLHRPASRRSHDDQAGGGRQLQRWDPGDPGRRCRECSAPVRAGGGTRSHDRRRLPDDRRDPARHGKTRGSAGATGQVPRVGGTAAGVRGHGLRHLPGRGRPPRRGREAEGRRRRLGDGDRGRRLLAGRCGDPGRRRRASRRAVHRSGFTQPEALPGLPEHRHDPLQQPELGGSAGGAGQHPGTRSTEHRGAAHEVLQPRHAGPPGGFDRSRQGLDSRPTRPPGTRFCTRRTSSSRTTSSATRSSTTSPWSPGTRTSRRPTSQLGMLYIRNADSADARRHLEKFLEMAPDHEDAASAREALGQL